MTQFWLPLTGLIWLIVVLVFAARERRGSAGSAWWRDLLAGGALFLLALGFFWRTLSGDVYQPADGGDLVSFLFPTYRFAAGELAQGRLPLWNPTLYSGAPFVGDIQAGFLYLPNLLLFLFMPDFPYVALQWLAVGHLYWAGLGVYALLRSMRWSHAPVGRLAAMFGAVAFMFCDPLLIHFGNLNLIAVLSWLPWVLAAFVHALDDGSLRWAGMAGLLFAVSTYAGHAQSTVYLGLALLIYAVGWAAAGLVAMPPGRRWQRSIGLTIVVIGLTVLLAAPILLPAAELSRYTARSSFTYQDTVGYSLAPTQAMVGLLTPGMFGRGPALHWGLWERVELPYVGVVALLLAGLGLCLAPPDIRRRLWPWIGMAAFGLLVAFGIYAVFHGWLTVLLPFFEQFRAPARAVILWATGLSVIAAVGVDLALKRVGDVARPRFLKLGSLVLVAVVMPLSFYALLVTQSDETAFLRASVAALALALATLAWLLTWAVLRAYQARWFGATTCGLLLIGLLYGELAAAGAYTDISSADPTTGFRHPEIVAFLRADGDRFRIDTRTDIADLWQPDTAALAGLEDVGGVANPLTLQAFTRYWESMGGRGTVAYDLLNVKYVVVRAGTALPEGKFEHVLGPVDGLEVYQNLHYVPRAWIAPADVNLELVDPADVLARAEVARDTDNRLSVAVETPSAGYLVLSEVNYPGWEATLDGVQAPIETANGLFRAIPVPAGSSTIELRFWPQSFQWGLIAAVLGLLLFGLLMFLSRRRSQSKWR